MTFDKFEVVFNYGSNIGCLALVPISNVNVGKR